MSSTITPATITPAQSWKMLADSNTINPATGKAYTASDIANTVVEHYAHVHAGVKIPASVTSMVAGYVVAYRSGEKVAARKVVALIDIHRLTIDGDAKAAKELYVDLMVNGLGQGKGTADKEWSIMNRLTSREIGMTHDEIAAHGAANTNVLEKLKNDLMPKPVDAHTPNTGPGVPPTDEDETSETSETSAPDFDKLTLNLLNAWQAITEAATSGARVVVTDIDKERMNRVLKGLSKAMASA